MIKKICMICIFMCLGVSSGCKEQTKQQEESVSEHTQVEQEYEYEIHNGAVKIVKHKYNNDLHIVVPEQIEGKNVEILGPHTFYQHKNTVSITLPENLTTMDGSPFYRCYSLKEIYIPKNVSQITSNPFFRSSSLEKIIVDPDNPYYSDQDGVLYDKDKTELISYPEGKEDMNFTVPRSVKKLDGDPFGYRCKIKRLTILSNVTNFPEGNLFVYPDDIIIIVEKGSAAEQYVKKQGLQFEVLE